MNDRFEKFTEAAGSVRLTGDEKDASRRFLVSYMQMRPIRSASVVRAPRFVFPQLFTSARAWSVLASVLVVTLASGGVSYAAEGAVPGDLLYPVKVNVNEEVRAAVAIGPRAKAQWDAERAERRLEEVETLVERKAFDAGRRERVEEAFSGFADRVSARVAELEEQDDLEGAAEVSERMETAMRAHQRVLERFAEEESDGIGEALRALADTVEAHAVSASVQREEVENVLLERPEERRKDAAAGRRESVRRELESAKKNGKQRREQADPAALAPFDDTMLGASAAITAAEEAMRQGDFTDAFKKFGKAHRDIRRADLELRLPVRGGRDGGEGADAVIREDADVEADIAPAREDAAAEDAEKDEDETDPKDGDDDARKEEERQRDRESDIQIDLRIR